MSDSIAGKKAFVCKYLSYSYRAKDGSVAAIRLPLVHIRIKSSETELETIGLVDTGATKTLIPKELAEILLLKCEREAEVTGAGGIFISREAKLKRLLLMKNVTPFATFVETKVLVPDSKDALPYVILGRDHVFKRFDITFHENRQKMTFTKL